ncbi:hypothetical protein ACHAWF_010751 [Thalassiosira exigua]
MKRLLLPGSSPLAAALIFAASTPWWCPSPAFSTPAPPPPPSAYATIRGSSSLLDPITGAPSSAFLGSDEAKATAKKTLVAVLPQLGEFDSAEYCELVIWIGDKTAGKNFCDFVGLDPARLRIDPLGHRELGVRFGPNLAIPDRISDDVLKFFLRRLPGGVPENDGNLRPAATAWLN